MKTQPPEEETPQDPPQNLLVPYVEMKTEEIRKLAMDISDGLVFGSWDIPINPIGTCEDDEPEFIERAEHDALVRHTGQVKMTFMPIVLGAFNDLQDQIINDPRFPKNTHTIVMFYEYLSEAGPRAINGYPCFFSCNLLMDKDAKKVLKLSAKFSKAKQAMVEGQ